MALYLPLCAVLLAWLGRPRQRRLGAAVLLQVLWVAVGLAAVQAINLRAGWWAFPDGGPRFVGMPLELYVGWLALWGALPVLAFRRLALGWVIVLFAALDCVTMPLCAPVVTLAHGMLEHGWWVGEVVELAVVLLPALLLARLTLQDKHVRWRGALQGMLAGGLFLWWMPEVVFAVRGGGWAALPQGKTLAVVLEAMAVVAVPGVSAVQEFCERGAGTPIPQDAPKRLVVGGVYRYVANPMQMSCALAMLIWGAALRSGWVVAIGLMSVAYSAGIARWDEREDLRGRFGERWVRYRAGVQDWRVRSTPFVEPGREATLYVAETCEICSDVAAWFVARKPAGMRIVAAEMYPGIPLRRMRYVAAEGECGEDGLQAFARGLEHLNVAWMLVSSVMRLPGLRVVLQAVADASGMGPRDLCTAREVSRKSTAKSVRT